MSKNKADQLEATIGVLRILDEAPAQESELSLETLHQLLCDRIRTLIDQQPEYFFQLLYRIDVNEQAVKTALAENSTDKAIEKIASLIIERQLQKIITRRKYSTGNGGLKFE